MNKKVLIVEDEKKIREILADYFSTEGFKVFEAEDGLKAIDIFDSELIDLVILDIMMPNMDGWSVCRRIRKKSDVVIIMLTAREDEDDKLMGFDLGADDYVTKPFSPKVLIARANTLLRRINKEGSQEKIIKRKGIEIDTDGRRILRDGCEVEMTPKEFDLLTYLIKNEGIVLTRDQILNMVWGYDFFGDTRAVDTTIKNLRKKLGKYGILIQTSFRIGYKFEVRE